MKRIAGLSGAKAALRSMRSERSMSLARNRIEAQPSLVLFARLVQRLAAEPVEANLRGPRQHQRAAAAIAIDALERQVLEHCQAAAGADRLGGDRIRISMTVNWAA